MWRAVRGLPSRVRQHGPGDPIIVHQMGKVGSRSVFVSLRALRMWRPLYHSHLLNDLDELESEARASSADPTMTLAEIERGRKLRRMIDRSRRRTWNVISLVRDPVERNVSAFFENLTDILPDAYERLDTRELTPGELTELFFRHHEHERPLRWFQTQLEPVFGIDVFSTPFDISRRYAAYEDRRVRLLVLRLENLAECSAAMQEFLGVPRFELRTTNVASRKRYAEVYRQFRQDVVMPDDYLSRMYDSRYARHFYSAEEIDRFWDQWARRDRVTGQRVP